MKLFKKILKWFGVLFVVGFLVLFVIRWFHIRDLDRTELQVQKIHGTKLQLSDVMGENLPPDPGAQADATIAGVDANENGIRDDVELAIFKAYPNSAKTRAVLLQYALALQMEFIQPFVNTTIATEVIREEDRADSCVADTLVPRKNPESGRSSVQMERIKKFISFVNKLQINNKERDQAQEKFYENLRSYSSLPRLCDIDYSTLPN